MSVFEKALAEVLKVEGGFVDHPNDKGGPTNLGVTLATLSRFLGKPATIEQIKGLTPITVAPIYKKFYWDQAKLDLFPEKLAPIVFNQVILRGDAAVVKSLQTALGISVDGLVGPSTIAAINSKPIDSLIFSFLRESHASYIKICQRDPSQLVFLSGWSNRVFDLLAQSIR